MRPWALRAKEESPEHPCVSPGSPGPLQWVVPSASSLRAAAEARSLVTNLLVIWDNHRSSLNPFKMGVE